MSLVANAIRYLQQNYPNASFIKDIILEDAGNGPYIKYWGLGSPKPSEAELNAAAASMIPKPDRPSVQEQLNMIYMDMKNNTKEFVKEMDKHQ